MGQQPEDQRATVGVAMLGIDVAVAVSFTGTRDSKF